MPGADVGLQAEDPTIAELLKPLGYATGQFGKNHLGDLNEFLPTVHGFDEFFGNLYHLNAEEEPEQPELARREDFPQLQRAVPARAASCTRWATDEDDPTERRPLRARRQAADRGHRPADRRSGWRRSTTRSLEHALRLHRAPARGRRSRSSVVQHHAHALPHAPQAGERRPGRALAVALPRHDDRPRQGRRRRCWTCSTSSGIADDTIVDVQHRQRAAHEHVAGRRA